MLLAVRLLLKLGANPLQCWKLPRPLDAQTLQILENLPSNSQHIGLWQTLGMPPLTAALLKVESPELVVTLANEKALHLEHMHSGMLVRAMDDLLQPLGMTSYR